MAEPRPRDKAERRSHFMAHSLGERSFSGCTPLGLVTGTGRAIRGDVLLLWFLWEEQVIQGKQVSIGEFDKLQQILGCGS